MISPISSQYPEEQYTQGTKDSQLACRLTKYSNLTGTVSRVRASIAAPSAAAPVIDEIILLLLRREMGWIIHWLGDGMDTVLVGGWNR